MEKLFILVRKDLPLAYQGVQGGHAVAEYLLKNPNQNWNNQTLVYLGVEDLDKWIKKLEIREVSYTPFREPDLGNQITAIATHSDGRMFKQLKLMGT